LAVYPSLGDLSRSTLGESSVMVRLKFGAEGRIGLLDEEDEAAAGDPLELPNRVSCAGPAESEVSWMFQTCRFTSGRLEARQGSARSLPR